VCFASNDASRVPRIADYTLKSRLDAEEDAALAAKLAAVWLDMRCIRIPFL